jgi:hypothetical protein
MCLTVIASMINSRSMLRMFVLTLFFSAISCVPPPGSDGRGEIKNDRSSPNFDPNAGEPGASNDDSRAEPRTQVGAVDPDLHGARTLDPQLPNGDGLRFATDVRPILDVYCTECHHAGKALDFTQYPRGPASQAIVELMISAATTTMPPHPRDRMPPEALATIRAWKLEGMRP